MRFINYITSLKEYLFPKENKELEEENEEEDDGVEFVIDYEEEPEEDNRTLRYQSNLLPREIRNNTIDRYAESDAGQFLLNNEDHFRSGKYNITFSNLGIEKIERYESEDEEEEVKNENKNKTFKSDQCVICCDKPPTYLFCSCGHLCICKDCFLIYDNNKCPLCKIVNPNIREI